MSRASRKTNYFAKQMPAGNHRGEGESATSKRLKVGVMLLGVYLDKMVLRSRTTPKAH